MTQVSGSQCLSPEALVGDLMDVQTKELFGGMFEHMLQEPFRASALVPHQLPLPCLSQPEGDTENYYVKLSVIIHNAINCILS